MTDRVTAPQKGKVMHIPFTAADGAIWVSNVAIIRIFGYDVFLGTNGTATIVGPLDHPDSKKPSQHFTLLDTYDQLIEFATANQCLEEGVSVGPFDLAQLVGDRRLTLGRLTDEYISYRHDGTWEFVVPADSRRNQRELHVFVNCAWDGYTFPGHRAVKA